MQISEFPEGFDSNPEAKACKLFLQGLENSTENDKIQHQNQILGKLRKKIPQMKHLDEFKSLYMKTFLLPKKYIILK